jgi:hypothetical protein
MFLVMTGVGTAVAAPQSGRFDGKETAIDYAARGGIRDWHADDEQSIYLMDRTGRWYRATFSHRCLNLPSNQAIAFETDALGRFDRFSTIGTADMRCQVESIVRSPRPAAKGGKGQR